MHLNFRDQQLKITKYIRLLYINLMVTTNQNSLINTHTKKEKGIQNNTKDNHQITREKSKRRNKKTKKEPPKTPPK